MRGWTGSSCATVYGRRASSACGSTSASPSCPNGRDPDRALWIFISNSSIESLNPSIHRSGPAIGTLFSLLPFQTTLIEQVSRIHLRAGLVLFDIDGTLLLSGGAGVRAMTKAFAATFGVADAFAGTLIAGRTDTYLLSAALER